MAKQIISNKVYESLQVPTINTQETTGKILYANSFSGIQEVAMPDDIRQLLDSDIGLVGNNVLIQLAQKFMGYTNGPWYVDSRDGVIYIHNRKFQEEPHHHYIYQQENGEVLKVSFQTNYVTKNVKYMLGQGINPKTKEVITATSEVVDPPKKEESNPYQGKVDNTKVATFGGTRFDEEYNSSPTTNIQAEWKANQRSSAADWETMMKNKKEKEEYESHVQEYDSKGPAASYYKGRQDMLDNLSTDDISKNLDIATGPGALDSNKRAALDEALRSTKDPKNLEANIKKALVDAKYMFGSEHHMKYLKEEEVDPRSFAPGGVLPKGTDVILPMEDGTTNKSVTAGMEALNKDPMIEVYPSSLSITQGINVYNNQPYSYKARYIESAKVKIRRMKKIGVIVPVYQLYHDLFERYGGAENYFKALQTQINGGVKYKERQLNCNMTVVGRPSLESSQILILENVGKKWSGPWYIKRCTHQFDSGSGYLCQLELVKNLNRSGSTTSIVVINPEAPVISGMKQNGTTEVGKSLNDSNKESKVTLNFTEQEADFYGTYYSESSPYSTDRAKDLGAIAANKQIYQEQNAEDPINQKLGTVVRRGEVITSQGKVMGGKIEVHKVPQSELDKYKDRYDYRNAAVNLFKKNRENKK